MVRLPKPKAQAAFAGFGKANNSMSGVAGHWPQARPFAGRNDGGQVCGQAPSMNSRAVAAGQPPALPTVQASVVAPRDGKCTAAIGKSCATKSSSAQRRQRRRRAVETKRLFALDSQDIQKQQLLVTEAVPLCSAQSDTLCNRGGDDMVTVCSSLASRLKAGCAERASALAELVPLVLWLSFDAQGCRVVQSALDLAGLFQGASLAAQLRGHVFAAINSPHANYVIQKMIETLPTAHTAFVAEELCGVSLMTARHRYGCRVVCRLIEHCANDPHTAALVAEVSVSTRELSRDKFGQYVVKSILEHGTAVQRQQIVRVLRGSFIRGAFHHNTSHVIESALMFCEEDDKRDIADELLHNGEELLQLAKSQYGGVVIKALARHNYKQVVLQLIQDHSVELGTTKYGKRLLLDDEFAVHHNFDDVEAMRL